MTTNANQSLLRINQMPLRTVLLFFGSAQDAIICRADAYLHGGQVHISNPQEITTPLLAELQKLNETDHLHILPENVLAVSGNAICWFIPAQERQMEFAGNRTDGLSELNHKPIPQPPLVMIATSSALYIYALKEDRRPQGNTPLMLAPYFNVFGTNAVCQGSMFKPEHNDPQHIRQWEESFYLARFTHPSSHFARWTSKFTHLELWRAAIKRGSFDTAWLIDANLTLQQAINKIKRS